MPRRSCLSDTSIYRPANPRLRQVCSTTCRCLPRRLASLASAGTDPCSWLIPGAHDGTLPLASAGPAGVTPARTKQGKQFNKAPQQGATEGKRGMSNETTHHGVSSFESMGLRGRLRRMAGSAGSEIVQLPDHHPGLVEDAIDVTEETVDEGLHGLLLLSFVADTATIALQCCSRFSQA